MAEGQGRPTLEDVYGDWAIEADELEQLLETSLHPRPPEMLFDLVKGLGISSRARALDAGCRDARHSVELVQRFGCRVVGIDVVPDNLQRGQRRLATAGVTNRVILLQGSIEAIPLRNGVCDFIWCRDMLNHVPDLVRGLAECARVVRAGGAMLIYHTFATDFLEPREAASLYRTLAIQAPNMQPVYVEEVIRRGGWQIVHRDVIGSEWREYWEEGEAKTTSKGLLRLARMRRARDRFVAAMGAVPCEVEMAGYVWGVYQMLGKLRPTVYTLSKSA